MKCMVKKISFFLGALIINVCMQGRVVATTSVAHEHNPVRFDTLFYASSYKQVFDRSMHCCACLDMVLENAYTGFFADDALDAFIYHIAGLQTAVARMVKARPALMTEDFEFLRHFIQGIEQEAQPVSAILPIEWQDRVKALFNAINRDLGMYSEYLYSRL